MRAAMVAWIMALVRGAGGLVALLVGLRGRRIDEHPRCAACRFELFGLYPGVGVCPECGSGLSGTSAIRIGHRRRP